MSVYAAKKAQIAAAVANTIAVQFGLKKGNQAAPVAKEIKAGSILQLKAARYMVAYLLPEVRQYQRHRLATKSTR